MAPTVASPLIFNIQWCVVRLRRIWQFWFCPREGQLAAERDAIWIQANINPATNMVHSYDLLHNPGRENRSVLAGTLPGRDETRSRLLVRALAPKRMIGIRYFGSPDLEVRMAESITPASKVIDILSSVDPFLWEVLTQRSLGLRPPISAQRAPRTTEGPLPDPWSASNTRVTAEDLDLHVQVAALELVNRIVDASSTVSMQGGDGAAIISRSVKEWVAIDDGDGTGKLPRHVFPKPWAVPLPRPPRPNEVVQFKPVLAAAALGFSSLREGVQDEGLRAAVDDAIDVLIERANRAP
ncbi:hypothetical protein [Rhodococcus sp. WB1]|uniref:hypothetical protein n=1 Tax=Rhodococcus sp. WB1 TaxID=1033922 RepID=UPI001E606F8A|nr:hypothetical protein [Rhodococcus sp. WB1]